MSDIRTKGPRQGDSLRPKRERKTQVTSRIVDVVPARTKPGVATPTSFFGHHGSVADAFAEGLKSLHEPLRYGSIKAKGILEIAQDPKHGGQVWIAVTPAATSRQKRSSARKGSALTDALSGPLASGVVGSLASTIPSAMSTAGYLLISGATRIFFAMSGLEITAESARGKGVPAIGRVVTLGPDSAARHMTVETIGDDFFTAIWEEEGQRDRRVRFPVGLIAADDLPVFRPGAEFYWMTGRQTDGGQPKRVDELRFRRVPTPPADSELAEYSATAAEAIAAQQEYQRKLLG